jgi:hypothetical protein
MMSLELPAMPCPAFMMLIGDAHVLASTAIAGVQPVALAVNAAARSCLAL